jgi:hypothetical protein
MLGHSGIKLTVDTYGKWLPKGNPAIVDGLDGKVEPDAAAVAAGQENPIENPVVAKGAEKW